MYTQVYFHDVRRVYDLHLKEFLEAWLPGGKFSAKWEDLLKVTDHEVLTALREAAADPKNSLHFLAIPLMKRKHFRTVYEQMSIHRRKRPDILDELTAFAMEAFGEKNVRRDDYRQKPKETTSGCFRSTAPWIARWKYRR